MGNTYDMVVIGGGPAGATASALLAEAGCKVLVLEAAKFPRFIVGEIIAPTALWRVWHRLGIPQETLDELFIRKWAGGWEAPDGTVFCFDQDVHPEDTRCRPFVYSVERASYDEFLLDLARRRGAEVLEEAFVDDVLRDDSGRVVGVRYHHGGSAREAFCDLVIDASGRANILARKLELRLDIVEMKSFSAFAHFEGAKRNEGKEEGDVRIVFGEDMWFWWAPLKCPKASVGIVGNADVYWDEYAGDPEAFYDKYVTKSDFLRDRLAGATRITSMRPVKKGATATYKGYHYHTKQLLGDGFALVGDAGGFIDPIFSAGLFVAQTSAMWLAEEVLAARKENDLSARRLQPYQKRFESEFTDVLRHIQTYATYYFDPSFVNFYLRLGNSSPRMRRLYIDTFVAYDEKAIAEYTRLIDRHFKPFLERAKAARIEAS